MPLSLVSKDLCTSHVGDMIGMEVLLKEGDATQFQCVSVSTEQMHANVK